VPPTIAEATTQEVGTALFSRWVDYKYALGERTVFAPGSRVPLGLNCFPQETTATGVRVPSSSGDGGDEGEEGNVDEDDIVGGLICSMDHTSPGFSFQITTTVYRAEGSMDEYDFDPETLHGDVSDIDSDSDSDGQTAALLDQEHKQQQQHAEEHDQEYSVPVAVRIDITISATTESDHGDTYARDALVEIVPFVTNSASATFAPIWDIRERRPPGQILRTRTTAPTPTTQTTSPVSLETLVLSNTDTFLRIPVLSSSQKSRQKKTTTTTTTTDDESSITTAETTPRNDIHPHLDIWHTQQNPTSPAYRSLFLHSTLRTTTAPYGIAHAEAFVHPGLSSHSSSQRILLISQTPLPYIREILKYRSVDYVTVVGADLEALEEGRVYMPRTDDCRGIEGRAERCSEDESVVLVGEGVEDWMERMMGEVDKVGEEDVMWECEVKDAGGDDRYENYYCSKHPFFDVVMVDMPQGDTTGAWIENGFQRKLKRLMTEESMLIVNYGSVPWLDGGDSGVNAARNNFLATATIWDDNGLEYTYAHAYDEPLAAPLDNVYIIATNSKEAYYSFTQKNPTGCELDFVRLMRPQPSLPTQYYDGYTHQRYITPSRAWENWFCNTGPGKNSYVCDTFRPNWYDLSRHSYATEVRRHPVKGRSLFTSRPVPKGHFLLPHDAYLSLQIDHFQWTELNEFVDRFPDAHMFRELRDFFETYGFETYGYGTSGWSVSFTNATFTNHACEVEDQAVSYIEEVFNEEVEAFSPVLMRRVHTLNQLAVAVRDLEAGEEVMIDYTSFRVENADFVEWLDGVCQTGVGLVPVEDNDGDAAVTSDGGEEL